MKESKVNIAQEFVLIILLAIVIMRYLIIIVILLLLIIYTSTYAENFDNTEAIQTLSSLYNTKQMTLDNLNVTQTLNVNDNFKVDISGNLSSPIITTSEIKASNSMNINNNLKIDGSGNIIVSGNISIGAPPNQWTMNVNNNGELTFNKLNDTTNYVRFGTNGRMYSNYNMNEGMCAIIVDGGGRGEPLFVGQGLLEDIGFPSNAEDLVWVAPGYGVKLWDAEHTSPPDYNSAGDASFQNTSTSWKLYNIWGSNRMDFWKVYHL